MNEALSLTNEPGLLANAALDVMTGVLGVECAWLQTSDEGTLLLAAGRGLTPAIEAQLTGLDQRNPLRQAVMGHGETAAFPDLSNRNASVPPAFRRAGLRWLVAAPLMTHRAAGIVGVASGNRKKYDKELPSLVRVLGGMIGGALQKVRLGAPVALSERTASCCELSVVGADQPVSRSEPVPSPEPVSRPEPAQPLEPMALLALPAPREDSFFQRHKRRMALFRLEHGLPQG